MASALDASQPDFIFHLAAQPSVEFYFKHPLETQNINTIGTANLLEAVRIKDVDAKIIFAGSSEEYGMVSSSQNHSTSAPLRMEKLLPLNQNQFQNYL